MARLASLSEPPHLSAARRAKPAAPQRARGRAEIAFRTRPTAAGARATALSILYQEGSAKIRLPSPYPGASPEAVFINTAGGLTGGDRLAFSVSLEDAAHTTVTTQAAERIYRASTHEPAHVDVRLSVGSGGRLDWLPQETILFDRSALARTLTIDLAADATLLAVEAFVFGRSAMGETVRSVALRDAWRVRRGGRLVFADGLRIDGDAEAILRGPATGGGAAACATLLYVAPDADARLEATRAALAHSHGKVGASVWGASAWGASAWGASAWNGMLLARFLAPSGQALRRDLVAALGALRIDPLPRVWNC
jgi:urease accessory protein